MQARLKLHRTSQAPIRLISGLNFNPPHGHLRRWWEEIHAGLSIISWRNQRNLVSALQFAEILDLDTRRSLIDSFAQGRDPATHLKVWNVFQKIVRGGNVNRRIALLDDVRQVGVAGDYIANHNYLDLTRRGLYATYNGIKAIDKRLAFGVVLDSIDIKRQNLILHRLLNQDQNVATNDLQKMVQLSGGFYDSLGGMFIHSFSGMIRTNQRVLIGGMGDIEVISCFHGVGGVGDDFRNLYFVPYITGVQDLNHGFRVTGVRKAGNNYITQLLLDPESLRVSHLGYGQKYQDRDYVIITIERTNLAHQNLRTVLHNAHLIGDNSRVVRFRGQALGYESYFTFGKPTDHFGNNNLLHGYSLVTDTLDMLNANPVRRLDNFWAHYPAKRNINALGAYPLASDLPNPDVNLRAQIQNHVALNLANLSGMSGGPAVRCWIGANISCEFIGAVRGQNMVSDTWHALPTLKGIFSRR